MKLPRFDRPRANLDAAPAERPSVDDERRLARKNDPSLGVRHTHDWKMLDAMPRMQSAHDSMRWDVSKSRILSVENCAICNEYRRESVTECTTAGCNAHKICERPYR